jgi:protein-tyrosine phosphatase
MREITQLHYSGWPDFGAPAQPGHLLSLVELTNRLQRGALPPDIAAQTTCDDPENAKFARPILVHCSAGCGRTGTFCTVDSVIDMLKRQRKEHHAGVTPMDVEKEAQSGYVSDSSGSGSRDEEPDADDNTWVFDADVDLVERTVQDFRMQRISMVQSLRQYVLCYETVLEWIGHQCQGGRKERRGSESMAPTT